MIARPSERDGAGGGEHEAAPDQDVAAPRAAREALAAVARELRHRLEVIRGLGWQPPLELPAPARRRARRAKSAAPGVAAPGDPKREPPSASGPGLPPTDTPGAAAPPAPRKAPAPEAPADLVERERRRAALAEISAEVAACTACRLCEGRTRTVFGVGDPCARLMFIGEGPGHDEDRLGEPFVGKAGQLLDRMIAAMGLSRERVYIANIVKCRPPGNRNPEPLEVASCLPYLKRQIEIVRPSIICTLGAVAARELLGVTGGIMRTRGRMLDYDGIPVMPTLHPAYLLRNTADKGLAWEDLQKVIAHLRSEGASTV